jgi:uncharacterized protein with beta-barrel porin domain
MHRHRCTRRWAHDFDPDRSIAATFQSLPGASFVANGAAQVHDSALTTASMSDLSPLSRVKRKTSARSEYFAF